MELSWTLSFSTKCWFFYIKWHKRTREWKSNWRSDKKTERAIPDFRNNSPIVIISGNVGSMVLLSQFANLTFSGTYQQDFWADFIYTEDQGIISTCGCAISMCILSLSCRNLRYVFYLHPPASFNNNSFTYCFLY